MYNNKNTSNKKNIKKLALNLSCNNITTAPPPLPLTASSTTTTFNHKSNTIMQQTNDYYKQGPACILPNLYLGAYYNALNATQLGQYNINCIINVASEVSITTQLEYHHIHWKHAQNNLASSEFTEAISKIELALQKGQTILVHCQQGIERSAALIIAYILYVSRQQQVSPPIVQQKEDNKIKGQNWSLDHALKYVQERAPGIRPNMELLYQLREYDKSLIVSSSTMTAKKHDIQTRTRRSESIACCSSNNNNRLFLSSNILKSSHNNQKRPRSASLKESSLPSSLLHEQNHQKENNSNKIVTLYSSSPQKTLLLSCQRRQKLAAVVLLVVLTAAVLIQQQRKLIILYQKGDHHHSNSSTIIISDNNNYVNSYFLKPVSIY